ncbi:MAG: 1-deoxy-D-xylulose-5-phosphate synthase [Steroidobacteraceae bacterium]|jgi:1-deoxy-D-xylulose-5-phosphate synthase|nr:1-deoxy-D-xylulose-5-phosphate synthase [Steroidobacteraceae bacterium]
MNAKSRGASAFLDVVATPEDLRRLPEANLPRVANELREFLLQSVAAGGGHLASGLGTVELAIALHYVYDTPRDSLVWDVGHQAYAHKALTGRRGRLHSIRKRGGISGFLKRDESEYDAFGAGHSSTSISAALGIAVANRRLGSPARAAAVIGDGALTAGLAFEALDHAGATDADLVVVLNDNGMSISENVGALAESLARRRAQDKCGAVAPPLLAAFDPAARSPLGQFFGQLGFVYHGPVDGHDVVGLVDSLRRLRAARGCHLLHVVTKKGKGYAPAEADPIRYHGVTPFDPDAGLRPGAASVTYTQVFGDWLCEAAARDPRLVAVTPAMREGSGLVGFARQYPERYFDVGIAEQHAVTFAAGLATRGLRPVVAIYSTFLQRAYDQLVHDVALQRLPVTFAIDRAGLVGPDGATHNGALDLSFLRCVPDLVVMAPSDGGELRDMLHTAAHHDGTVAVRYPRATTTVGSRAPRRLPIGQAEVRRHGTACALLAFGTTLAAALEVAEGIDATVVNMRFVKPLDERLVAELARSHELLVTLEENAVAGGAGAAVGECLAARGVAVPLLHLGLPDRFVEHGTRDEVLRETGLDAAGILAAIADRHAALLAARRPHGPAPVRRLDAAAVVFGRRLGRVLSR